MGSSSGRGRDIEMSEIERERERLLQTEPPFPHLPPVRN